MEEAVGRFLVSCRFKNVGDQFEWAFLGIFGPNLNKKSKLMWEELARLNSGWNFPWCLGGNFNVIHSLLERLGAKRYTRSIMTSLNLSLFMGLWTLLWRGPFTHGLTLAQLLEKTGFSSLSNFCRVFHTFIPKKTT